MNAANPPFPGDAKPLVVRDTASDPSVARHAAVEAAGATLANRPDPVSVIRRAEELRRGLTGNFRDEAVSSIYAEAERISRRVVRHGDTVQGFRHGRHLRGRRTRAASRRASCERDSKAQETQQF